MNSRFIIASLCRGFVFLCWVAATLVPARAQEHLGNAYQSHIAANLFRAAYEARECRITALANVPSHLRAQNFVPQWILIGDDAVPSISEYRVLGEIHNDGGAVVMRQRIIFSSLTVLFRRVERSVSIGNVIELEDVVPHEGALSPVIFERGHDYLIFAGGRGEMESRPSASVVCSFENYGDLSSFLRKSLQ